MLNSPLMDHVERSGFHAPGSIIHLFIGGSELHGAKVGTTDDIDLYGVFLDSPEITLGLEPRKHFVWSTASDDRRNGPGDVELTLYSLKRWAQLAVKGNATALHFIFAQATAVSDPLWTAVQGRRELFLSKDSATQFLGFADNQRRRITGEAGRGAKGRRPEYEGRFGYDAKAAMHCLRLYLECIELMNFGTITLPRPERDYLVEVRSGEWPLQKFIKEGERLRAEAERAATSSHLPDAIDRAAVSALVAQVCLCAWRIE